MRTILLACDDDAIAAEVDAALVDDETRLAQVTAGHDVIGAVRTVDPDLVILDMQIGNMGGLAACRHLRLESGAGRIPSQRIVLLKPRPGRIDEIIDVDLPGPRWGKDVRALPAFTALRTHLWDRIQAMGRDGVGLDELAHAFPDTDLADS